ncbi:MAG: hypothetical protein F6K14_11670 [Symploca sp. SIO2C1]|nr:hypothetical protein [Symploca sp. SIO2C1]
MTLIQSKQVSKVLAGHIKVSGFSASGGSSDVTTALGAAVATAGSGGVAVPLQPSPNEATVGVVTVGNNRVEIDDGGFDDGNGNEVYGRLTESGGVYSLTYYSLVGGVQTPYTFAAATSIDFEFSYRFDFARVPADFAITSGYRVVGGGGSSSGGVNTYTELLTITATNTLANLTKTPDVTANVLLIVNGVVYSTLGNGEFSLAGKVLNWIPNNAGFSLEVTDKVVAQYTSLE